MTRPPAKDDATPEQRHADRAVVVLLLILAAAAVLRMIDLSAAPPSQDELWSLELSSGRGSMHLELPVNQVLTTPRFTELDEAPAWHKVWTTLDRATHPPLYFMLLRGWRELFGAGDAAARSLSVVASLVAIVMLYDASRLFTGSRSIALWASALMAFARPQVEHARIVRNYALLLCFAMVAWWAVARMREAGARKTWGWAALLGLACAAMLLTHYFAVGAVAALVAYAVFGLDGRHRRLAIVAIVAGTCIWFAAWGPMLIHHAQHFSAADPTTEFLQRDGTGAGRILQTVSDIGAVPLRLLVTLPQRHVPFAWMAGVACGALLVIAWRARRREVVMPILWLAGTVGFIALLDLTRSTIHLECVRYLIIAAPGLCLLIAAAVPEQWGRDGVSKTLLRHALPTVVTGACLLEVPRIGLTEDFDWTGVAEVVDEPGRAEELLVFRSGGQSDWFAGYQVMAYAHASKLETRRWILLLADSTDPQVVKTLYDGGPFLLINLSEQAVHEVELFRRFTAVPVAVPGFPPVVWELRPP